MRLVGDGEINEEGYDLQQRAVCRAEPPSHVRSRWEGKGCGGTKMGRIAETDRQTDSEARTEVTFGSLHDTTSQLAQLGCLVAQLEVISEAVWGTRILSTYLYHGEKGARTSIIFFGVGV